MWRFPRPTVPFSKRPELPSKFQSNSYGKTLRADVAILNIISLWLKRAADFSRTFGAPETVGGFQVQQFQWFPIEVSRQDY
jgi:hypothetical protein